MTFKKPLLVALALAVLAAPASLAAPSSAPPASLRDNICSPAVDPALRGVSTTAVMGSISGTHALRMRFVLLRAPHAGGPYRVMSGPNLGRWVGPPDPTLGRQPGDVWTVSHPVVGLSHPDYYRLRVDFKWLGAGNHRLAGAVRTSPPCHLRELRPDLVTKSIAIAPATTGRDTYVAVIHNRGVTAAAGFPVELRIGGQVIKDKAVPGLGAHATRRVHFSAPACTSGQAVTVIADPAHRVPDYDAADNALTVFCPKAT